LLEESFLAGLVLANLTSKVLGLCDLVDLLRIQTGQVDLLRGGDNVSGVNTSQGNTIDLKGASDEKDTLVEGLKENDTLASESASQKDEDGAGGQGFARSPRSEGLADL
jgi:hypothetical protein